MNPQPVFKTLWLKEKPLIALVVFTSVLYSVLSILRHWHFGSNTYDLGLFDQMVWHYSRFEAPASTSMLLQNSLGDHFSPVLALCAPLYWLFPHVETLLVVQAVLFGVTLIPLFLFCKKRVGRNQAYCLAVAFIFFWGVQNTTGYDFHPDVFAVPLIAFAVYFIDLKNWWGASLSILTLLFVKEDLTLLVAAFGIYLGFHQKVRLGLLFSLTGLFFFYLEVAVIIPHFNNVDGSYNHWIYRDFGGGPGESLKAVLQNPFLPFDVLFSNGTRVKTLLFLFTPFLFLPLFSRQMILIIPLIAAKLLAAGPNYWGLTYHYSATLCPLLVMAAADGLFYWRKKEFLKKGFFKSLLSAPTYILMINLILVPILSPWRHVEHAAFWTLSDEEKTGSEVFALIPAGATVATQSSIAPHLSERKDIYALGNNVDWHAIRPDFFVANRDLSSWPITYSEIDICLNEKMKNGYKKVFEKENWVVLERGDDAKTEAKRD
jgi:uncharacterized membrane protein